MLKSNDGKTTLNLETGELKMGATGFIFDLGNENVKFRPITNEEYSAK